WPAASRSAMPQATPTSTGSPMSSSPAATGSRPARPALRPHWPGRWAWGRHQPQHRPGARGPWPWSAASRQRARPSTPAPEAGPAGAPRSGGCPVQARGPGPRPRLYAYDGLFVTGGDTAARVLKAAGVHALDLVGEVLPRTPMARLRGGCLDGMPVVLKAGAFGPEDAIHRAMEALHDAPAPAQADPLLRPP